ncbi:MAG: DNA-3-methyladenine glycosylase I [Limnobacter sp.]|uniref:DNA-3-methyladenine glycosylase I n=1 Tax=Limnobacter sp. TaxID=2003368 RepID=UPI00391C2306
MNNFSYKAVFELIETSLIEEGKKNLPESAIRGQLDQYKVLKAESRTDDEYFNILVMVTFYSGFKAETVTQKREVIKKHFPNCQKVARYNESDIAHILADSQMIRHGRKIRACVENAKRIQAIATQHGSLDNLISSFQAEQSLENLLLLKEFLEEKFEYLGGITAYHFMTDIGLPVLKPDRVVCRIFERLGLLENSNQLLKAVLLGRKFAQATGHQIRYIDIVLVAFGQISFEKLGIKQGVCLLEPRCTLCKAKSHCQYAA